MNVPLKVETFVSDGSQYLKYWYNSNSQIVRAPFNPYFYSTVPNQSTKNEMLDGFSLLYDRDYEGPLYKCSVRTTKQIVESRDENSMEANVRFVDRVYIDNEDFLSSWTNTDQLKVLSLDIETDSYLTFPTAEENAIIAIGLQLNDSPIQILMANSYKHDEELLRRFVDIFRKLDPDVIVTYNGNFFDWPYIVRRMQIAKIPTGWLSRDGSDIYFRRDRKKNEVREVCIGGRIHYDIYARSVLKDQNLFTWSPKTKDMKTIARLYGLKNVIKEPKEIMSNMRSIVNSDRLKTYLTSDIKCTTFLTKIYLPAIINQAEYLKISLDTCVNMSPSYTGNMIFSRKFKKLKIISDMTVGEAYPELAENKEGALVKTFKFGLFKELVRDVDIMSFYPNLIRLLNLCPTTTRIIGTQNTLAPFSATLTKDNFLILSIPDKKAKKQIIIEIDRNRQGFASSFVDEIYEQRVALKAHMKTLEKHSADWTDADVNQLNLKVIMNALTGFFGQKYARFGSLACYIAITGTGRFILQEICDRLGDQVIAINTDGLYTLNFEALDDINHWLEDFIKETFYTDKNYIWLEESVFDAAYFVPDKEKQYMLLDGEELIIHGGSLKSSRVPNIYSRMIEELGYKMLTDEVTSSDVSAYYNKSNWSIDDIQMGLNCKLKSDYKSPNNIAVQLIDQFENRFSQDITSPTKLFYVKTVAGRHGSAQKLVTIFDDLKNIHNLDTKFYTEKVLDQALDRLSLSDYKQQNRGQKSLFDFQKVG